MIDPLRLKGLLFIVKADLLCDDGQYRIGNEFPGMKLPLLIYELIREIQQLRGTDISESIDARDLSSALEAVFKGSFSARACEKVLAKLNDVRRLEAAAVGLVDVMEDALDEPHDPPIFRQVGPRSTVSEGTVADHPVPSYTSPSTVCSQPSIISCSLCGFVFADDVTAFNRHDCAGVRFGERIASLERSLSNVRETLSNVCEQLTNVSALLLREGG